MTRITRHLIATRFGQIHCREAGNPDAPAVIILHINQQSSALQLELMEALAPRLHAVAMDYPSHGMSDHVGDAPSIADYAECAAAVMSALAVDRFTPVGEATGAAVAMELGIRDARRIDGVVLLNCPYYRNRTEAHAAHATLKTDLRPTDPSGFPLTRTLDFMHRVDPTHAPLHPDQSWMDRINVAQIEAGRDRWQALDALNAYDVAGALSRLDRDTLLLMGEHFHYTAQLDAYRQRLQRLVAADVIPQARFCMAWEKATDLAARIVAFIDRPH